MLITTVAAAQAQIQLSQVCAENRNFTTAEVQESASRKFMQIFGGSNWVKEYVAQGYQGEISRVREVQYFSNAYDQAYIPFC